MHEVDGARWRVARNDRQNTRISSSFRLSGRQFLELNLVLIQSFIIIYSSTQEEIKWEFTSSLVQVQFRLPRPSL